MGSWNSSLKKSDKMYYPQEQNFDFPNNKNKYRGKGRKQDQHFNTNNVQKPPSKPKRSKKAVEKLNNQMEALILKDTVEIPRCSTPITETKCYHCEHDHRELCCLYAYDCLEDGPRYSNWKFELEKKVPFQIQNIPQIPEAISGNLTPKGFPGFTFANLERIEYEMRRNAQLQQQQQIPPVWMRQFFYPMFSTGKYSTAQNNYYTPFQHQNQQMQQPVQMQYLNQNSNFPCYQPYQQFYGPPTGQMFYPNQPSYNHYSVIPPIHVSIGTPYQHNYPMAMYVYNS